MVRSVNAGPPTERRVADALRVHVDAARGTTPPLGIDRASLDERHRLALVHPQYDGFLVLHVTAHADLDDVRVHPDEALARVLTPHHAVGPLHREQTRSVDLELHPRAIGREPVSGLIHVVDGSGAAVCAALRCTLAADPSVECTLAGAVDGPWSDPDEFEQVVRELLDGTGSARALDRRIGRVAAGRPDPGWPARTWWRRRSERP